RIAEEYVVGEARGAQPFGQPLAFGDAEEIGDVDELCGLLSQGGGDVRMRMAERIDRHPRGEIEIALPCGRGEPSALALREGEVDASKSRQKMRRHGAARLLVIVSK